MKSSLMNTLRMVCFAFALAAFAASANAQLPIDVRPAAKCDRIIIGGWVDATSAFVPNQRVFGYDFQEDPDFPYFISDPGFNTAGPSTLPAGQPLSFNVLSGADFGLPSNLGYWSGSGPISFSAPPSDETIQLRLSSASVAVGNTLGEQNGFTIQTISGTGSVHRHLSSVISGGAGVPASGIYLMALELTVPSLEDSLPFFLVYKNGVDEVAQTLAMDWVKSHFIYPLGDFNLDHSLSSADIQPMLKALTDLSAYQAESQLSDGELFGIGDINGDCKITNADIQPLLNLIAAGEGPQMVPEPSSLILAVFGSMAAWNLMRSARRRPSAMRVQV
jgi:hypothetical protein